jgi:tetratricopeptide (TPR) repeat protein
LLAASGGYAGAAPGEDPGTARAHYDLGMRFYQVGDYHKAIDEFRAAYVAHPDPAFVYDLAQCHRQLGEASEALTLFRRYLALAPASPVRPQVERRIRELEAAGAVAQPPPGPQPALASPALAMDVHEEPGGGRRWWLWAGLGVVAAAVATGLIISMGRGRADPACPADVTCPR